MPMYDIFCPECDNRVIDIMIKLDEKMPLCKKCETEMKRIVGCTHFELIYDNRKHMTDWNGNSSRYWDEIKKSGGEEPKNKKQPEWW